MILRDKLKNETNKIYEFTLMNGVKIILAVLVLSLAWRTLVD